MVVPWTDAHFTIQLEGTDMTGANDIHVTIAQGEYNRIDTDDVTVVSASAEESWLAIHLTQAQTSRLMDNAPAKMMVNWLDGNGERQATNDPCTVEIGEQLLKEILGSAEG